MYAIDLASGFDLKKGFMNKFDTYIQSIKNNKTLIKFIVYFILLNKVFILLFVFNKSVDTTSMYKKLFISTIKLLLIIFLLFRGGKKDNCEKEDEETEDNETEDEETEDEEIEDEETEEEEIEDEETEDEENEDAETEDDETDND